MQGAYAALVGMRSPAGVGDVAGTWGLDPADVLLGPGAAHPNSASWRRPATTWTGARDRDDRLAAQLFWQTVRVRTIFDRHVTQRPLTPGLPWFIRFYGRMAQARGDVTTALLMEAAAVRSGRAEGLTSLEMRTSPDNAVEAMLSWVRSADELARTWAAGRRAGRRTPLARPCTPPPATEPPEHDGVAEADAVQLGLVFHFVKFRSGEAAPGVPYTGGALTTADPESNANTGGYRYGTFYGRQRTAVHHGSPTAAPLAPHPSPRPRPGRVRGRAGRAQLGVPASRDPHPGGRDGGRSVPARPGGAQPAPLQTTVHAGEDFSHSSPACATSTRRRRCWSCARATASGTAWRWGSTPPAGPRGSGAWRCPWRTACSTWRGNGPGGRGGDAARIAYLVREIGALILSLIFNPPAAGGR